MWLSRKTERRLPAENYPGWKMENKRKTFMDSAELDGKGNIETEN